MTAASSSVASEALHFAGGEAARAQRPGVGRENPFGGEFASQRLQPSQNRLRRADGELLRDDAPDQSAEEVAVALEFRQSDLPDELPELRHLPAERPFFRFSDLKTHFFLLRQLRSNRQPGTSNMPGDCRSLPIFQQVPKMFSGDSRPLFIQDKLLPPTHRQEVPIPASCPVSMITHMTFPGFGLHPGNSGIAPVRYRRFPVK